MTIPTYPKPGVRAPWAQNAVPTNDIVDPGFAYSGQGWPQSPTPPARQYFNWILNYLGSAVRYFCQRGIADWDTNETYQPGAIVNFNGIIFANSGVNNTGVNPTSAGGGAAGWGPPSTSTASAGDNTNLMATNAFVTDAVITSANAQQAYTNASVATLQAADAAEATARAAGDTAALANAEAYTAASVAPLAPKASPAFTGTPTAPTPPAGDNSQRLATTAFAAGTFSAATNGYAILPGGLILQWGCVVGVNGGAGPATLTFPIAFPNNCFSMTASSKRSLTGSVATGGVNNLSSTAGTSLSTTGAIVVCDRDNDGFQRAFWIAIGN